MRAITKMVSGQPYRLDGYDEYILSAVSSAAFTATLEGQVQTNVEGVTQSLEWITLAALTDGTPQNYDTQTPFIRVNILTGTPVFHLQRLERGTNRSQDLSKLRTRLDILSVQNPAQKGMDYTYATVALFTAAPIVNGKTSYVLETGEYFEAVGGVQVYRGGLRTNSVSSIAALRDYPVTQTGAAVQLRGYYSALDSGGGVFDWVTGTRPTDDAGVSIWHNTVTTGYFKRRTANEELNPAMFGALRDPGDDSTDSTTAFQNCINAAIAQKRGVVMSVGTYVIGTITLNDAVTVVAHQQRGGVASFRGIGNAFGGTILRAKVASYATDAFLIKGNNFAGVSIGGFRIDGATRIDGGADFSWVGGSDGNPTLAPSNRNTITDIWCSGTVKYGLNLNQCHDGNNNNLSITNGSVYGVSLEGGGGKMVASNVNSTGLVRYAGQNGAITDSLLAQGLELTGGSYNMLNLDGTQVMPNTTNNSCIYSSAIGNGTHSLIMTGGFLLANTTKNHISGRWHAGAKFIATEFLASTAFFGTITNGGGAGSPACFDFDQCSFQGTDPTELATAAGVRAVVRNCVASDGSITEYKTDPIGVTQTTAGKPNARLQVTSTRLQYYDAGTSAVRWWRDGVLSRITAPVYGTWNRLDIPNMNHNGLMVLSFLTLRGGPGGQARIGKPEYGDNFKLQDFAMLYANDDGTNTLEVRWRDATVSGFNSPEWRITSSVPARIGTNTPYPRVEIHYEGFFGEG